MDPKVSALERAFQLAGSGGVAKVDDIKKQLKQEGYDESAMNGGRSLRMQLKKLIHEARERKGDQKVAPTRSWSGGLLFFLSSLYGVFRVAQRFAGATLRLVHLAFGF
jgi:hypothetical protein